MTLFITFEGGDGSGKSTQIRSLFRKLSRMSIPVISIREPGGTLLGNKIRYLLKQARQIPISPLAELMLFNASRSQLVHDVIQPGLQNGKIVLCDRFTDSTIAYQSYGRGLALDVVKEANRLATQGLQPDLTVLLDVPPEMALSRKQVEANDRFEQETLDFHQRVRDGFLKLAEEEPQRWRVIDATSPRRHIAHLIWGQVSPLIDK